MNNDRFNAGLVLVGFCCVVASVGMFLGAAPALGVFGAGLIFVGWRSISP